MWMKSRLSPVQCIEVGYTADLRGMTVDALLLGRRVDYKQSKVKTPEKEAIHVFCFVLFDWVEAKKVE